MRTQRALLQPCLFHLRLARLVLASTLLLLAAGCDPDFEDETPALVKKAELLSMVLQPPQAAPGQQVTASFLMVDESGPMSPSYNLWLPASPEQLGSGEGMQQLLSEQGFPLSQLTQQRLTFAAGPRDSLALWLLVPVDRDAAVPDHQQGGLFDDLAAQMDSNALKLGTRTLVISDSAPRLQNPDLQSIVARVDNDSVGQPLTLVRYDEADLGAAREAAAAAPLTVPAGAEVEFTLQGVSPEDTRIQWASTGGDFKGQRKSVQPFEAPEYRPLAPGQPDANLYPVWLILRSGDSRLPGGGQSWFEFYLRVMPATSSW